LHKSDLLKKVFRFFSFLGFLGFTLMHSRMQYTRHKNTTKSTRRLFSTHCYDELYQKIAPPINSNKFVDFDLEK